MECIFNFGSRLPWRDAAGPGGAAAGPAARPAVTKTVQKTARTPRTPETEPDRLSACVSLVGCRCTHFSVQFPRLSHRTNQCVHFFTPIVFVLSGRAAFGRRVRLIRKARLRLTQTPSSPVQSSPVQAATTMSSAAKDAPAASTVPQTTQMKNSVAHVLGQRSKSRFFNRCAANKSSNDPCQSGVTLKFFFFSLYRPFEIIHSHACSYPSASSPIHVTACAAYQSEWYAVLITSMCSRTVIHLIIDITCSFVRSFHPCIHFHRPSCGAAHLSLPGCSTFSTYKYGLCLPIHPF